MIKSLVKNYLKCCLFGLILGLMYASPATADVCFLPSGGCQSQTVRTTPNPSPNDDCSRFTRQGYTAFGAAQSGVDCQLCNGTYYCKCDGNYKKDGNRCVERCSATDYPLTSKKAAPWRCEACSDPLSNNYNKRYKNCTCPSPYTQIDLNKCVNCQGYNVSANDASTKKNNGYTCSACDNDVASGKYKCSCSTGRTEMTINGIKKCVANCTDSKKELDSSGQCVCKSIYRTYNNTCYEQCESPKVASGANCVCPAEYNHTKADNETCTGTTCDGKYRASDCSILCDKTCSAEYKITAVPITGAYSSCTDCDGVTKYKCDKGSVYYLGGSAFCWHGCDTMNYANGVLNEDRLTSYVEELSNCPSGTRGYGPIGPMYNTSMFEGTPMHNKMCYACAHDDCESRTASLSCVGDGSPTYTCTYNVPDCAGFSDLKVVNGGGTVLVDFGTGNGTRQVSSSVPSLSNKCQFWKNGTEKVEKDFQNNNGKYSCSYTTSR